MKNELRWGLIILFFVLIAYILPYTLLTNVTKWYGSFFVWIILTIIVIGINYLITKNWGKEK
ncbi:hypothetical protein [Oceanobacillus sp. Castelsardo]|uniref:hypothetical protein n=1 Tax=Oceanobacillus sp. Castelsardo TaxID=1851204 RepID=UPI000837DC8D|nr:hypothetical protein [Oceanobacillus sp. Castelsardo]